MGGICPCSRASADSKVKQDTDKPEDEARKGMLANDASALRVGKQPPYGTMKGETITYETLNTTNKHKPVKRAPHQTSHKSAIQQEFERVSGVDDTGKEHNSNKKSNKSKNKNKNNKNKDDSTQDDSQVPLIGAVDFDASNSSINANNNDVDNDKEPIFLSSASETLVARNGGFSMTNGEYRWFLAEKKWCFFTETGTNYIIEGNVGVDKVYTQLTNLRGKNADFRWNNDVTNCWVISDMEGEHIYYAAPAQFSDKIPSNFGWISVHGSDPGPLIVQNKSHDSQFPEDEEDSLTFGNRSVSSLMGRHPSSRVNNIETLPEEDDANIQETPKDNDGNDETNENNENNENNGNNDSQDEDEDESDVSAMSE